MRSVLRYALCLLVLIGGCVWAQRQFGEPAPARIWVAGSRPIEPDTRLNQLQTELRELKEELGFYQHDLAFTLPADEKLIARFEGELNGKPCPKATFAFRVPAPDEPAKDAQGSLSMRFIQPKFQLAPEVKHSDSARWVVRVCTPQGVGNSACSSFRLPSPVDASAPGSSWGVITSEGNLQGGKEQKVWEWQRTVTDDKGAQVCDFKWRLLVHTEKKAAGERRIEMLQAKDSTKTD